MNTIQSPSTVVIPAERRCPRCGGLLGGFGPEGLCGVCLFDSGLAVDEPVVELDLLASGSRKFGDYELLEEIARGGMGVIFKARHLSLNRIVAVKMILRGGFASVGELARFRAEAETAARLQHPNIVAIHEVGECEGQPYFSMDYVEGQNLAQLIGNAPLPATNAAKYLKIIAEAVQYAHSRGVLHRDLKPSNVLIDATDQPRVTDFGLAKQLDSQLSANNLHLTQTGQVLGSPSFMPPEQAAGKHDTIGPSSDVYSLGAMLYHALTGRPPFVAESVPATLRLVSESEPVSPRLLNASVPRDLETICLKCLQKEPQRRYATAQELADELGRYLQDEPIHARPVAPAEKAWRWCRRNRALAAAGAAVLVLLLTLAIGSPIAALRINRERLQAEAARRQALADEKQAKTEAAKSQQVAQFLKEMVNGVGPSVALGRDTELLQEILNKMAERVGKDLKDQPEVEAELRTSIGLGYDQLGLYAKAEAMQREALALRKKLFGDENLDVAASLNNVARAIESQDKYVEAESLVRESLAIRIKLLGNENVTVAYSINSLGVQLIGQGKLAEAEPLFRQALAMRRKLLGNDHRDVANSLGNLAGLLYEQGKLAEAEAMFREEIAMDEKLGGAENPEMEITLDNLANIVIAQGRPAEGEAFARRALALQKKMLSQNIVHRVRSLWILNGALLAQGKLADAEQVVGELISLQPQSGAAFNRRGEIYGRTGRWKEATAEFARVIELEPKDAEAFRFLAPILAVSGDSAAYRKLCQQIVSRFAGTTNAGTADTMAKSCLLLPASGVDLSAVAELAETAVTLGKGSEYFPWFELCKGLSEYRQGHFAGASDWTKKALASSGKLLERDACAYLVLAMAQMQLKEEDASRVTFAKAVELMDAKIPKLDGGDLGEGWVDKIIANVLLRESRGLIEPSSAKTSNTSKAKE